MADSRVITANGSTLLMTASMDSRIGNVTLNDAATWTSNRPTTGFDVILGDTSAGAATVTVSGTGASIMNGSGGPGGLSSGSPPEGRLTTGPARQAAADRRGGPDFRGEPVMNCSMPTACRWSIGVFGLAAAAWLTPAAAADPKPTAADPKATAAEAEATAAAWLDRLGDRGLVLDATLAEPGFVVRQGDSAIGRITRFDLDQDGYRLSFAFRGEHTAATPAATLRAAFWQAVIDRVPTPGLDLPGWETRPLTPASSFDQGVELVDFAAGRATFRVQTEFFALSGRDPTVLVPADAPAPPGSFFQLRRKFPLDHTIPQVADRDPSLVRTDQPELFHPQEQVPKRLG